ncbi:hypothetical protein D3C81_1054280 [compost metagenome]
MLLDGIRQLVQQHAAQVRRGLGPTALERPGSCRYRRIDLHGSGILNAGDGLFVGRVDDLAHTSLLVQRRPAVDEAAQRFGQERDDAIEKCYFAHRNLPCYCWVLASGTGKGASLFQALTGRPKRFSVWKCDIRH